MKILSYKIVLFLIFNGSILNAQKIKENYKEEFVVTPNVVIDVNTRHSDIEIETWNKNKVVIEAFMMVDGVEVTEKMKDDFYDKWNFKAIGNKEKITITSRSNSNIDIHSFDFDSPDYSFFNNSLSDFSLGSLDILDSLDFIMPPLPPMPPMENLPSEFNFEAYKEDKNYLEKWKKENKDVLGKNAKVKIGKNSISITSDNSNITMSELKKREERHAGLLNFKEELKKERRKMLENKKEKLKKERRERKKLLEKRREELEGMKNLTKKERKRYIENKKREIREVRLKKLKENRRVKIQKRGELVERRKEILSLLKKRSKLKIKRFIRIKAPKNAKFNMNVKYGALSFSK